MPGDPQNVAVVAVNSTAIRVEWKPPVEKEQFGVIRGYQIHVQEIDAKVFFFYFFIFLFLIYTHSSDPAVILGIFLLSSSNNLLEMKGRPFMSTHRESAFRFEPSFRSLKRSYYILFVIILMFDYLFIERIIVQN